MGVNEGDFFVVLVAEVRVLDGEEKRGGDDGSEGVVAFSGDGRGGLRRFWWGVEGNDGGGEAERDSRLEGLLGVGGVHRDGERSGGGGGDAGRKGVDGGREGRALG